LLGHALEGEENVMKSVGVETGAEEGFTKR